MIPIFDFNRSNENELQYIWRICSAKDSGVLSLTWNEVADILNKNLFEDETEYLGESAYRKKYQQAKSFYDDVFSKMEPKDFTDELAEQKRELERLKIQYRDERNAWNKQNYTDARVSQKLDYLETVLSENGKVQYQVFDEPVVNSDNDLLVMLTDWHIGQTFNNAFGSYNTDLARDRLNTLLNAVLQIRDRHDSEKCYVFFGGDSISGNIHKSIQVTNRENVIDQVKIATDLLTSFCYRLCAEFSEVYLAEVSGNHSRIDKKDDALHDERLDELISWITTKSLSHVNNFHSLNHRKFDIGIVDIPIRGKTYIGVHGDYDTYNKTGVSNLCMMLGFKPDYILYGHLHTCAIDETSGVKMIRSGSLSGSGDQYTLEKRLSGKPSQMVCVCTSKGVDCYYPIEL